MATAVQAKTQRVPGDVYSHFWEIFGHWSTVDFDDICFDGLTAVEQLNTACAASQSATDGLCLVLRTLASLTGEHLKAISEHGKGLHPERLLRIKDVTNFATNKELPPSVKVMSFDWVFKDTIVNFPWPKGISTLVFYSMAAEDYSLTQRHKFPSTLKRLHFLMRGQERSITIGNGFVWPASIVELSLRVDENCVRSSAGDTKWPRNLKKLRLVINPKGDEVLRAKEVSAYLGSMPSTVVTLTLELNKRICNALQVRWPASLKGLTLLGSTDDFGNTGNNWPTSLKELDMWEVVANNNFEGLGKVTWPSTLEKLVLPQRADTTLEKCVLPQDLRVIVFPDRFDNTLPKLPRALQSIKFGSEFNQMLHADKIPEKIECMIFGTWYNQPFDAAMSLPQSLRHLELLELFDRQLPNFPLPPHLVHLKLLGYKHQLPSYPLPGSLEYLKFGVEYNHPLPNFPLPPSLIHLNFGASYNHALPNFPLPPSLIHLNFGASYNHALPNFPLPDGLKTMWFCPHGEFNAPLPNNSTLPRSLVHLVFPGTYNQALPDLNLPPAMKTLQWGNCSTNLADVTLPWTLEDLYFGPRFNATLGNRPLPSNLRRLRLGADFNHTLPEFRLPLSLLELEFGESFNQPLPNFSLPPALEYLRFGQNFRHPLPSFALPYTLRSLEVDVEYDQPLPNFREPPNFVLIRNNSAEDDLDWGDWGYE